jgi:hypothetical protein
MLTIAHMAFRRITQSRRCVPASFLSCSNSASILQQFNGFNVFTGDRGRLFGDGVRFS